MSANEFAIYVDGLLGFDLAIDGLLGSELAIYTVGLWISTRRSSIVSE